MEDNKEKLHSEEHLGPARDFWWNDDYLELLANRLHIPYIHTLVAFYFRYIKGHAVFIAALLAEAIVLYCHFYTDIAFLWFNVIGCGFVIFFGFIIQAILNQRQGI